MRYAVGDRVRYNHPSTQFTGSVLETDEVDGLLIKVDSGDAKWLGLTVWCAEWHLLEPAPPITVNGIAVGDRVRHNHVPDEGVVLSILDDDVVDLEVLWDSDGETLLTCSINVTKIEPEPEVEEPEAVEALGELKEAIDKALGEMGPTDLRWLDPRRVAALNGAVNCYVSMGVYSSSADILNLARFLLDEEFVVGKVTA